MGLRGRPDDDVARYAQVHNSTIITADLAFGNVLRFPVSIQNGIVIARFPNEISSDTLNGAILTALREGTPNEIQGHLLIVEPGRVRLRKLSSPP